MVFSLANVSSFSIIIAGIIAIARFKNIHIKYYPFIYCILIAGLNEIFSEILIHQGFKTLINNNIYNLLESVLLIWLFYNFSFYRRKPTYIICSVALIISWVVENVALKKLNTYGAYFIIQYSTLLVFLSINHINKILLTSQKSILTNIPFLLCTGFIIYFTYRILIMSFFIYNLTSSLTFLAKIYNIMLYINLIVNILYIIAVSLMPKKQEITLSF
jgi:hypothetical protein